MGAKIGLKDAISIGIGGMVGGGIFAVLGLAVSLSKGATPVSFLVAGLLALITSYSYVKLSMSYPDRGGTVKFINKGYGIGVLSGSLNNLLWISYIIMLSLYASAFGSYAPNLFTITGDASVDFHIYATLIVVFATLINYYSIAVISKIEKWAVVIKLTILLAFVVLGLYGLNGSEYLSQMSPANWESTFKIIAGGMIIFVAYEGFELIANAAPDIENPKINIPKAYYYSVVFVIALYIVIAIITVGSLAFDQIAAAEEYVLAEAAKPLLGETGFTIITIAALISTFSAINASLYGGSRVSYELAEDDELPHQLTYLLWNQPVGLMITVVCTILITNTVELENISTAGSVGFLIVFAAVNYSGFKLRKETGSNSWIPLLGFFGCVLALVALVSQQMDSNPSGIIISVALLACCFIGEFIYKRGFDQKNS